MDGVMIMTFSDEFPGNHSSKENLMSFINRTGEIFSFLKRHIFWPLITNITCNQISLYFR